MTTALTGKDASAKLAQRFASSIIQADKDYVLVKPEAMPEIVSFLKTAPGLEFDFLNSVTAVDYFDYFEVVYHLTSMKHNQSLVLKTRLQGRDNLSAPSIIKIHQGADFQEREIYDLFGIEFEGHPNMKRILLWDGFEGYPLRKDYL
ncbi:MAG TPA: NADH-quinone oxidoreductase subunit C [Dehalococcoidales bacterium]|nr:NADH-quinone oxidoreductase subunit C [Dehalococcoidales bacterium]